MDIYVVILLVLLLIFLISGIVRYIYSVVCMVRNKWVPTVGLFKKHKKLLSMWLHISKESKLIDLWCGTGTALRFFSDTFHCKYLHGVDINTWALCRWNILHTYCRYTHIHMWYQDMYTVDLASYDYVYVFLMPRVMQDIEKYFMHHLNDDTVVIVNSFPLPTRKPFKKICDDRGVAKIFLYKKWDNV